MKKVPIEELMKQTFPNGVFVDSEGFDIRYRFDGEDYPVFINETDSHEAAAVVAHCLNTNQMLLDALKAVESGTDLWLPSKCDIEHEHEVKALYLLRDIIKTAIQSASYVEVQE